MKKLTESEKNFALYSVRVKASASKCVYEYADLQSIKINFIDGICSGLISAGFYYENSFLKELQEAWENEPPFIK